MSSFASKGGPGNRDTWPRRQQQRGSCSRKAGHDCSTSGTCDKQQLLTAAPTGWGRAKQRGSTAPEQLKDAMQAGLHSPQHQQGGQCKGG